jgi:hypothetical protein
VTRLAGGRPPQEACRCDGMTEAHHLHVSRAGVSCRSEPFTLRRVMGGELAEAVSYARRIEATGSDDEGTWPGGEWFRARSLPHVYDANHVVVLEHGFAMSLQEVSAAADEIQAGLPNRIVEFVTCPESEPLAAAFRNAGWLEEPLGVMVRGREPDRRVDTSSVRVVDESSMRPARAASIIGEPLATLDAVAQVREKQERVARGVLTTPLGVIDEGKVVSFWGGLPSRRNRADRKRRDRSGSSPAGLYAGSGDPCAGTHGGPPPGVSADGSGRLAAATVCAARDG